MGGGTQFYQKAKTSKLGTGKYSDHKKYIFQVYILYSNKKLDKIVIK